MVFVSLERVVKRAIARAGRKLPKTPVVDDVIPRLDKDSGGDDAVYINVVLSADTPEDRISWATVKPIHDVLSEAVFRLRELGIELWPYVIFLTVDEARRRGLVHAA